MTVELPSFLTRNFFEEIFTRNFRNECSTVAGFWGEWATKKGDNYASEMYRIHIDYELRWVKKTRPVLLKVRLIFLLYVVLIKITFFFASKLMPRGEIQVVVMIKNNIFPREIQVYSELLPEVEKLLKSVNDHTNLTPTCLHTSFDPKNSLLVFEDMRAAGYRTFPRGTQINFDQAIPIIKKLAKLHAASAMAYEQNLAIMDLYLEGSISENPQRQDFLVHYQNCPRVLGLVIEKEWGPEWQKIAIKLQKLSKKITKKGCELYVRDDKSFNVFNHDDLWLPNVLVKFDELSSIKDILFIDFQLSYFGSPGIDLNFFFYGSLNQESRVSFKTKLIKIYYETLSETLVALKFPKPIPSLHDIHVEILKTGMNGVLAAIAEVPLLIVEQSDNLQMDMLLQNSDEAEEFRHSLFNNANYKQFIQKLLLEFDDLGYLD